MARVTKSNPRCSVELLSQPDGVYFECPNGSLWDSNDVTVLHSGLDTVRQLYNGLVLPDVLERVLYAYDAGFREVVRVGEFDWVLSSGGRSGYRFILNNENIGLTVMYCSSFTGDRYNGAHLKIQCSPVFLLSRSIDQIQRDMDDVAKSFISQVLHSGVACHICADFQGWIAPVDLDARLVTKAHRVQKKSGIQGLDYKFSDVTTVYGRSQSFTFGVPDALQFACYNKLKAVKDKGELPLWFPVWAQNDDFDEGAEIWRIEARFHHNVVEQFARGSGFHCSKIQDLEKHLTGLWQYALQHNRLDFSKSYIDPFWQFMRDDVVFYHQKKLSIDYKRMYKSPAEDGLPSDRAVLICFGQLCSIYRKKKVDAAKAVQALMRSEIWDLICGVYQKRGLTVDDLIVDIQDKVTRKKVVH